MLKPARGVTLIELIAGIVVLAISLTLITSVLGPLYIKSADPWHQVRAAELGHSLMNEIMAKSFDENSSRSGSLVRCDEGNPGENDCTDTEDFGPEAGENRLTFDDVDDFNGFSTPGHLLSNILNEDLTDAYRQYQVSVQVYYAGTEVGMGDSIEANRLAKRITVSVTTPTGDVIDFSAYKGNW